MRADALLDTAKSKGNPIINGSQVTLVWQGKTPPVLICDLNNWQENDPLLFRQAAPDVWIYETALPQDAYLEYAFILAGDRVRDPLNPRFTPNGIGKYNNYFYMPGASPTPWAKPARGGLKGTLTTRMLPTFGLAGGKTRNITFYQPPVSQPVPALVVWDGNDYHKRARLPYLIENLARAGKIEPLALILIPNGKSVRAVEYACSDATLFWLEKVIWPAAEETLKLVSQAARPAAHCVLGASMGGLMALYTSLRLPERFGKAICQSGAYRFDDFPMVVNQLLAQQPRPGVKLWLDVGRYEGLQACNQEMRDRLEATGYDFFYREYNGGHNYPAWRDELPLALTALFPVHNPVAKG